MTDASVDNPYKSIVLKEMEETAREYAIGKDRLPIKDDVACYDCPAGLWYWTAEKGEDSAKLTCFCKTYHQVMWDADKAAVMDCDGFYQAVAMISTIDDADQKP